MSLLNRKKLYDYLIAKGNFKEASAVIVNHPEMAEAPKEIPKVTKSKGKK